MLPVQDVDESLPLILKNSLSLSFSFNLFNSFHKLIKLLNFQLWKSLLQAVNLAKNKGLSCIPKNMQLKNKINNKLCSSNFSSKTFKICGLCCTGPIWMRFCSSFFYLSGPQASTRISVRFQNQCFLNMIKSCSAQT